MTMEVSAEVHFAQTLASNDKKFRDRALKRLKKYIGVRSSNGEGIGHDDFIKLWKGLHYCMWMQDKPLVQEELSKQIVSLLHAFPKLQDALSFVNAFFITEAREWTGIDRLRLDKFMLLIREMLHESFQLLGRDRWPESECRSFSQNLTAAVMNEDTVKIPYGIKMHLADIYMDEMKKVSFAGMTAKKLTTLMFPFIYFVLKTNRRELAQIVYDKTLQVALQEFGDWPWGKGKRKNVEKPKSKNKRDNEEEEEMEDDDEGSLSGEERDDEDEDASDEEGDEDDGDDDADLEDDEEDMDMEFEEEDGKKERYDLSSALRLMHLLARDSRIEVRNRRYVYGIVNNFASKDPTILQRLKDDAAGEDGFGVTRVIHLAGQTEKEESGSKRERKRNKKRRMEEEGMELARRKEESSLSSQMNGSLQQGEKKKNKKKKKSNGEQKEVNVAINGNNHLTELPKQVVGKKNDKKRKMNEIEEEVEHLVETTPSKLKGKKRKRMSSDREGETTSDDVVHIKKMKISGDSVTKQALSNVGNINNKANQAKSPMKKTIKDMASPVPTPNKQKNKKSPTGKDAEKINNSDANSNAKSPSHEKVRSKKPVTLTSPVECVIYKQKSPKAKPSNIEKLVKTVTSPSAATTKFFVSDSSPSRPKGLEAGQAAGKQDKSGPPTKGGEVSSKDQQSPPRSKLPSPQTTPIRETGILGSLYDAVVKKAAGIVAPSTDPGASREKIVNVPEQWTPGAQKKVVFDLRRNKANKFKDYLKTLAKEPSPAFEPTKSPAQGILKSPSVESFNDSNNGTPNTKRRKGKGNSPARRKSKSPVLNGIL